MLTCAKLIVLFSRLSGSPPAEFDCHLNYNHLNECLKRLLTCYDELNTESAERDEMEAVFLLLNPGHSEPLLRYLSLKKRSVCIQIVFSIILFLSSIIQTFMSHDFSFSTDSINLHVILSFVIAISFVSIDYFVIQK